MFVDLDYIMYTIEYYHAHIVVKLKGPGPEVLHEVDRWVWARIPSQAVYGGELFAKVQKIMIHRRCGAFSQTQSCMKENATTGIRTCRKGFPQPFREVTTVNERAGGTEYCRPCDGTTVAIRQKVGNSWQTVEADNQYVVPCNPWPLMKYPCHIMVDIVSVGAVVKCLYKYCLKHPDFVRARTAHQNNEIEAIDPCAMFVVRRLYGALVAFWSTNDIPLCTFYACTMRTTTILLSNQDDPILAQQDALPIKLPISVVL